MEGGLSLLDRKKFLSLIETPKEQAPEPPEAPRTLIEAHTVEAEQKGSVEGEIEQGANLDQQEDPPLPDDRGGGRAKRPKRKKKRVPTKESYRKEASGKSSISKMLGKTSEREKGMSQEDIDLAAWRILATARIHLKMDQKSSPGKKGRNNV